MADDHRTKSAESAQRAGSRLFLWLAWLFAFLSFPVCVGQAAGLARISPALSTSFSPGAPEERENEAQFKVISGDLSAGRRVVIVVQDEDELPPGVQPSPYDTALVFEVTKRNSPESEARRLRTALDRFTGSSARVDLWAAGTTGLIVRYAVERARTQPPPVETVVLIDTPHRGLSSSGWPSWQSSEGALSRPPGYAVSGSSFLLELNRTPDTNFERVRYVNVWRERQRSSPRATVMNLPRPAMLAVVRVSGDSLWSVFDSRVIAVRRIAEGGVPVVTQTEEAVFQEKEADRRASRLLDTPAPSFAALIDNSVTELATVSPSWLAFKDSVLNPSLTRGPPANPFASMTDAVSVGYDPDTHRLIITGFEDFSREPLNADFFFSALNAFQHDYPAISIDPPAVTDPQDQAPVRYVGSTQGTLLGGLMFEADRVMKNLALGQDNVTRTPVGSDVPGYRSIAASGPVESGVGESMWRLWFEPERWRAREQGPYKAIIDARLRCRWERMSPDYAPGQAVISFTDNLTNRFHQYALEQPSMEQLDQASILVAMARWIYDANLTVVPDGRPAKVPFSTPLYTPLIEIKNQAASGPYIVTRIIQGGVDLGPPLRPVRDENSGIGRLMTVALQGMPDLQQGIPTQLARPPNVRTDNQPLPPHLARPPTVSWSYPDNEYLMNAVAFSVERRDSSRPVGSANSSDRLSNPVFSFDQRIGRDLPKLQPSINDVLVDDALNPPQITLTGSQFGAQGLALFNGKPLQTLKWTPQEVIVSFPPVSQPGTLILRSADRDSNPIEILSAPGPAVREPPTITVTNRTSYTLNVEIRPAQRGSSRFLNVAPGETTGTRLLPGRYTVTAQASGSLIVGATKSEERAYERGYAYSLVYEPASFELGELIVNNNTGGTLTVTVHGQIVTLPSGQRSTIRLPFGTHSVQINTRCGSETANQTISPDSIPELSYKCQKVSR